MLFFEEFELFRELQPQAAIVPVLSTGGAALTLSERVSNLNGDLANDLDYVGLFHRHLDISVPAGQNRGSILETQ